MDRTKVYTAEGQYNLTDALGLAKSGTDFLIGGSWRQYVLNSQGTIFADTAALLSCLDHVVCVDTAVAHLAGAMGLATSLLLPFTPDWRWQLGRSDSPWYPTLRLYRQQQRLQWGAPLQALAYDLGAMQTSLLRRPGN